MERYLPPRQETRTKYRGLSAPRASCSLTGEDCEGSRTPIQGYISTTEFRTNKCLQCELGFSVLNLRAACSLKATSKTCDNTNLQSTKRYFTAAEQYARNSIQCTIVFPFINQTQPDSSSGNPKRLNIHNKNLLVSSWTKNFKGFVTVAKTEEIFLLYGERNLYNFFFKRIFALQNRSSTHNTHCDPSGVKNSAHRHKLRTGTVTPMKKNFWYLFQSNSIALQLNLKSKNLKRFFFC